MPDDAARLDNYLERIGYAGDRDPSFATLCALHAAHLESVPFENLDVQLGRPLTTEVGAAYDKIVVRKRGGWCFEQNGVFGWALASLGFDVMRLSCSVMRQSSESASADSHLSLAVRSPRDAAKLYLADVGFGGSLVRPMELGPGEVSQPPFRLGLRQVDDRYWRFWEDDGGGEFTYDFVLAPADERTLATTCLDLQRDPESSFVLNLVVQRRFAQSHVALRGRVLKTMSAAGAETRLLRSAAELVETLSDKFGLDVPEASTLWPRITARHRILFGDKGGG